MKRVLGITGGIASGKSTLSAHLKKRGFKLIDADEISRNILKKGEEAYDIVMKEFPECVRGGEIDRRVLGNIVFNDDAQLMRLNGITHPRIVRRIVDEAGKSDGPCVIDAALLFETGLDDVCDEVWCVCAPEELRVERICRRDGLTPEEARMRISSQMSDAERARRCDRIFDSSLPLERFLAWADAAADEFLKGAVNETH